MQSPQPRPLKLATLAPHYQPLRVPWLPAFSYSLSLAPVPAGVDLDISLCMSTAEDKENAQLDVGTMVSYTVVITYSQEESNLDSIIGAGWLWFYVAFADSVTVPLSKECKQQISEVLDGLGAGVSWKRGRTYYRAYVNPEPSRLAGSRCAISHFDIASAAALPRNVALAYNTPSMDFLSCLAEMKVKNAYDYCLDSFNTHYLQQLMGADPAQLIQLYQQAMAALTQVYTRLCCKPVLNSCAPSRKSRSHSNATTQRTAGRLALPEPQTQPGCYSLRALKQEITNQLITPNRSVEYSRQRTETSKVSTGNESKVDGDIRELVYESIRDLFEQEEKDILAGNPSVLAFDALKVVVDKMAQHLKIDYKAKYLFRLLFQKLQCARVESAQIDKTEQANEVNPAISRIMHKQMPSPISENNDQLLISVSDRSHLLLNIKQNEINALYAEIVAKNKTISQLEKSVKQLKQKQKEVQRIHIQQQSFRPSCAEPSQARSQVTAAFESLDIDKSRNDRYLENKIQELRRESQRNSLNTSINKENKDEAPTMIESNRQTRASTTIHMETSSLLGAGRSMQSSKRVQPSANNKTLKPVGSKGNIVQETSKPNVKKPVKPSLNLNIAAINSTKTEASKMTTPKILTPSSKKLPFSSSSKKL